MPRLIIREKIHSLFFSETDFRISSNFFHFQHRKGIFLKSLISSTLIILILIKINESRVKNEVKSEWRVKMMSKEGFCLQKNNFLVIILWIISIVGSIEYVGFFLPKIHAHFICYFYENIFKTVSDYVYLGL